MLGKKEGNEAETPLPFFHVFLLAVCKGRCTSSDFEAGTFHGRIALLGTLRGALGRDKKAPDASGLLLVIILTHSDD